MAYKFSEKEYLEKNVLVPLIHLKDDLMGRGYTEEDAEKAIAGALPYCIFHHVIDFVVKGTL